MLLRNYLVGNGQNHRGKKGIATRLAEAPCAEFGQTSSRSARRVRPLVMMVIELLTDFGIPVAAAPQHYCNHPKVIFTRWSRFVCMSRNVLLLKTQTVFQAAIMTSSSSASSAHVLPVPGPLRRRTGFVWDAWDRGGRWRRCRRDRVLW